MCLFLYFQKRLFFAQFSLGEGQGEGNSSDRAGKSDQGESYAHNGTEIWVQYPTVARGI